MKYTCDYSGRLLETTDILGQRSTAVYDALDRVTAKKDNRANAQALPYAAGYTYDNNGRVIVEKNPLRKIQQALYIIQSKSTTMIPTEM